MSRIGKVPVLVPENVKINIDKGIITAVGSKGTQALKLTKNVIVNYEADANKITVKPADDSKQSAALWGLTRSNINNIVQGVSNGFEKVLEIKGTGFKASVNNNILTLSLGFAHDIKCKLPSEISVKCDSPTLVRIQGINKQKVGQFASLIVSFRKVEPYKGRGIRYLGQHIVLKQGKKSA